MNRVYSKQCRHGTFLLLKNDLICECMKVYGEWAEKEVHLFRSILSPGDTVLEIGSNIGTHSVPISKIIGDRGELHCFEPQTYIFQLLNGNLAINGVTNAYTFRQALGMQNGIVQLKPTSYESGTNHGAYFLPNNVVESNGIKTQITTVDTYIRTMSIDGLKLIKIDVEGMEEQVLRGAKVAIENLRPYLFMENYYWLNERMCQKGDQFYSWIESLGYQLYWYCCKGYNPDNFLHNPEDHLGGKGGCECVVRPQ